MNVIKILKNSAVYLQRDDLLSIFNETTTASADQQKEINLLISCVNFVCNNLSTNYLPLRETVSVIVNNNSLYYNTITDKPIDEIISIEEKNGDKVKFTNMGEYVRVNSGEYYVTFSYLPTEVLISTDNISCFTKKLTEQVFAYGVVSEFLFIMGNIDDATSWDIRFKQNLINICRPKQNIIMPVKAMK